MLLIINQVFLDVLIADDVILSNLGQTSFNALGTQTPQSFQESPDCFEARVYEPQVEPRGTATR